MSKCHFPQDNFTIILDLPSLQHIQLRLIETKPLIPDSDSLLSCLEAPQPSTNILQTQFEEEDSLGIALNQAEEEVSGQRKQKKSGCTCKKTNCVKMYCECFSVGKLCTPECACYGCHNHSDH